MSGIIFVIGIKWQPVDTPENIAIEDYFLKHLYMKYVHP